PVLGVPLMVAGFPAANDNPSGSLPNTLETLPWLTEMLNEPLFPTVKVATLSLRNKGVFATVTGNGKKRGTLAAKEPVAIGAMSTVKVPVVPAGGAPNKLKVPLPSSLATIQGGVDLTFQRIGVVAPLVAITTRLDVPATKVASLGGPRLAVGAG